MHVSWCRPHQPVADAPAGCHCAPAAIPLPEGLVQDRAGGTGQGHRGACQQRRAQGWYRAFSAGGGPPSPTPSCAHIQTSSVRLRAEGHVTRCNAMCCCAMCCCAMCIGARHRAIGVHHRAIGDPPFCHPPHALLITYTGQGLSCHESCCTMACTMGGCPATSQRLPAAPLSTCLHPIPQPHIAPTHSPTPLLPTKKTTRKEFKI